MNHAIFLEQFVTSFTILFYISNKLNHLNSYYIATNDFYHFKENCGSSKGAGENIRELSHAVKHLEINPQMTGKSHFRKPTPPRSKPSPSRTYRSCSVPQLQVCTTSLQGSHLGNVATDHDVSGKGVASHRQGQIIPSVDYSQYTHMFKNVLDYYGQKKLLQKTNESQLQLQNLLSLRS